MRCRRCIVYRFHTKSMTPANWINRFALLSLMFMLYGIGIAAGRDQATIDYNNHPACHPNFKP